MPRCLGWLHKQLLLVSSYLASWWLLSWQDIRWSVKDALQNWNRSSIYCLSSIESYKEKHSFVRGQWLGLRKSHVKAGLFQLDSPDSCSWMIRCRGAVTMPWSFHLLKLFRDYNVLYTLEASQHSVLMAPMERWLASKGLNKPPRSRLVKRLLDPES